MILYIHGFAGSGMGLKATILRRRYPEAVVAPSLPYIPELAFDTLDQTVRALLRCGPVGLVGSSLGGFYAWALAEKHGLKAVLVNPSVKPYETLDLWKGFVKHYHDLSHFEWTPTHIQTLRQLDPGEVRHPENYLLLLQKDDELLDYRVAEERFQGATVLLDEGGGHAYEGFEKRLADIEKFFGRECFIR
ncbi:YqiA/YcfP family alpha/beta fold hydrolase [Hydrogenimonas sp.]